LSSGSAASAAVPERNWRRSVPDMTDPRDLGFQKGLRV
jgi:hypothetical protein